jgi:hypothetical protein
VIADDDRYAAYIERAKQADGGHLHIGRGGFTLHFGSSRLSGYDCERIKWLCIVAGLPVIDSRSVSIDVVAKLAINGPMIAVNRDPDPRPWHALAYAPLGAVAAAYHRGGAEVFNIPDSGFDERGFDKVPDGPLAAMIDGWLAYVRRAAD